jgi:hypothetical protein
MMMIWSLWLLWEAFAPYHDYLRLNFFIDSILLIIVPLFIFLTGLLPVVFLARPHVKEYFKKPHQGTVFPVSSN